MKHRRRYYLRTEMKQEEENKTEAQPVQAGSLGKGICSLTQSAINPLYYSLWTWTWPRCGHQLACGSRGSQGLTCSQEQLKQTQPR